jgi:sn-glycerol 3-phosphate transport system substrate-binding protein
MLRAASLIAALAFPGAALATEVHFWHAMDGARGAQLEALVKRFNDSQKDVRVVAAFKGGYDETMAASLAAQRNGAAPNIVQVYEVGTGQMMAAKSAVRPLWQVLAETGERIDAAAFVPAVASYFSDQSGRLMALPFNTSTPILFYNRDALRKARLDPDKPPRTWYEMVQVLGELVESGFQCALTTVWPSWVLIENMSVWHNQDFATKENGLGGLDAKLIFNTHLMVRHISMLSSWARSGYFTYSGRRTGGEERFARGECAMVTASSSRYAELRRAAKFDFGAAALPHYDDIKGAPHHTMIGGAGLWLLAGRKPAEYRAAAKFLAYLAQPEVQAEWHQETGYVPLTRAAYELTQKSGFYASHPGHEIAIRQLMLNAPTRESRGIRLGEFLAIRAIIEEELEAVWDGRKPPKLALDHAAERGNELLRRFELANRGAAAPDPKPAAAAQRGAPQRWKQPEKQTH